MNGAQAAAWLKANQKPLAITGAVGVAGLALLNKKKGGGGAAAVDATAASAGTWGTQAAPQGAAYDSTSSDVYNAISPQIEALARNQDAITAALDKLKSIPVPKQTPVSTMPPPKAVTPPKKKPVTPPKKTPIPVAKKPVTPPKKTPTPTHVTYTVKPGDNLSRIASKYGTSWQTLYGKNKKTVGGNPNMIHPGQKLVIR